TVLGTRANQPARVWTWTSNEARRMLRIGPSGSRSAIRRVMGTRNVAIGEQLPGYRNIEVQALGMGGTKLGEERLHLFTADAQDDDAALIFHVDDWPAAEMEREEFLVDLSGLD